MRAEWLMVMVPPTYSPRGDGALEEAVVEREVGVVAVAHLAGRVDDRAVGQAGLRVSVKHQHGLFGAMAVDRTGSGN